MIIRNKGSINYNEAETKRLEYDFLNHILDFFSFLNRTEYFNKTEKKNRKIEKKNLR
jgi:hypothetical protein